MARTRHLAAGAVRLAATLVAVLAGSTPAPVPADVASWFEHEAATTILTTTQEMVVVDESDRPTAYAVVEVGEPRQVHRWTPALLTGRPGGDPVEPLEEWAAPFDGDGEPAGVVTAWREDGVPALAVFEDDGELAAALAALAPEARYAPLPELGVHLALSGDEVRTLVAHPPGDAYTEADEQHTLEEFRAAAPQWFAAAGEASALAPDPPDRSWLLPVVIASGALAALALGLLLRRAWRHTGSPGPGPGPGPSHGRT